MEPKAILFDLDGTLIDSLPGIEFAVDRSLLEAGLPSRQESLRSRIGPPIRVIFAQLAPGADEHTLAKLERSFRACYDGGAWRKTLVHQNAITTLHALCEAGMPLFVVTNKPALPTRRILEELGMAQYFSHLLSRDSRVPAYASKREMIRDLCSQFALAPEDCLYVGDTLEDYHAGQEAGMPVALVPHGYGSLDKEHYPESCQALTDLAELAKLVESMETL
jgi:phosphoglycolate phosphatase